MMWAFVCLSLALLASPSPAAGETSSCDGTHDPEVMSRDLRVDRHQVPRRTQSIICATLELPSDEDYIIVGFQPLVDQYNSMYLIGCDGAVAEVDSSAKMCDDGGKKSKKDKMAMESCGTYMGASTGYNSPGMCYGDNAGFPMGMKSQQRAKLVIKYQNDPFSEDPKYDNSGFRIFYKRHWPKVNTLNTLVTGQKLLEIPPHMSEVKHTGVCPGDCTRQIFRQSAWVPAVMTFMEDLGSKVYVEQYRDGMKIADLVSDEHYDTHSVSRYDLSEPLEIQQGDEIKTTCIHSSLYTERTTYGGMGLHSESCKAILVYFPADAISDKYCMSIGPLNHCDRKAGNQVMGCDWKSTSNMTSPTMAFVFDQVESSCSLDGTCRPECYELLQGMKHDPCNTEEAKDMVHYMMALHPKGREMMGRLNSCKWKLMMEMMSQKKKDKYCQKNCPSSGYGGGDHYGGEDHYGGSDKYGGPYDSAHKMTATSAILVVVSFFFAFLI